jgi:hypothetical protein
MSALNEWDNFYVIVGAAAGALIGLQFVVITLIAERPPTRAAEAGAAFATPTIVHFCIVLLLSALLCAPWKTIMFPAVLCGLVGLGGLVYTLVVAWRMRVQTSYKTEFEDWLFHTVLPLVAYGMLMLAAVAVRSDAEQALFAVGGAALVLLFCGIHNAWDAVVYHTLEGRNKPS